MIRLEKRLADSSAMRWLSPLLALGLTIVSGGLLFLTLGHNPLLALRTFFIAPLKDLYGWSELAVKMVPLLLCAVGLTFCFRARVWNIGAEGQLLMGALGGGYVALHLAASTGWWVLPLVVLCGALSGLVWAALAALLSTRFRANEILTTIMLNYIAMHLLLYAVHGPLRDPDGYNFPESALFSESALFKPLFGQYRMTASLLLAAAAVSIAWVVVTRTLLGFQIAVLGEDAKAARYAGFHAERLTWLVLLSSGALAGLAGICEAAGPIGQLVPSISPGYGYAAIIVVFLGRMHPLGIVLASALLGLTFIGGEMIQMDMNLPKALTGIFQGMLLFFLLACDLLIGYRLVLPGRRAAALATTSTTTTASPT